MLMDILYFDTREKAKSVLEKCKKHLEENYFLSEVDYYKFARPDDSVPVFLNNNWGFTYLNKSTVRHNKNGFYIDLPEEEGLVNSIIEEKKFDEKDIVRPDHYIAGRKYEPRLVIEDWGLNYYLGNALKYISRAGRKDDAIKDLKKAITYISFEIERIERKEI